MALIACSVNEEKAPTERLGNSTLVADAADRSLTMGEHVQGAAAVRGGPWNGTAAFFEQHPEHPATSAVSA